MPKKLAISTATGCNTSHIKLIISIINISTYKQCNRGRTQTLVVPVTVDSPHSNYSTAAQKHSQKQLIQTCTAPPPAETDTAYVGWSSREATAPRHGTLCVQVVCPDHQLAAPSLHHSIIPHAFQHQPVKQNTLRTAVLMTNSTTNSINANDSSYTYTKKTANTKIFARKPNLVYDDC